jgi:hypothetical protein
MGDLSSFERRQIAGGRLAGASVEKNSTLLGVSTATVTSTYTTQWKTTSTKRNSGRKST